MKQLSAKGKTLVLRGGFVMGSHVFIKGLFCQIVCFTGNHLLNTDVYSSEYFE